MPNWAGSDRRQRLPANWYSELRPFVLERDRYACQHVRADTGRRCGAHANQVDHIERGDDHDPARLQALCAHHHLKKSSSEGGVASGAARRARARGNLPVHPALR